MHSAEADVISSNHRISQLAEHRPTNERPQCSIICSMYGLAGGLVLQDLSANKPRDHRKQFRSHQNLADASLFVPYLLLRTLAIVRPTFPTVTLPPFLPPSIFLHGQFATTSCPILLFRPFFSFCLPSNSFPFLRISPAHSAFAPTHSPTYFEHLAVNMSLIKQGYVFPASVACGGVELPGIASSTTLFRSAAPSNPLPSSASGKVQFGEASLNCVSAASKRLSPSPPRPSTPLQCSLPLVSRPFCRKLDQGLLLSLLSFLRAQQRTLQFGIRVGDLVAWYVGRGAECLCFQVGLDLLEVTLAQIQKQVSPKPETYLWLRWLARLFHPGPGPQARLAQQSSVWGCSAAGRYTNGAIPYRVPNILWPNSVRYPIILLRAALLSLSPSLCFLKQHRIFGHSRVGRRETRELKTISGPPIDSTRHPG